MDIPTTPISSLCVQKNRYWLLVVGLAVFTLSLSLSKGE